MISHTDHPIRHWDRTCPACNESLSQALAQPEQAQTSGYAKKIESLIKERDELRTALAQPEQDHGFDRTASHMAGEYVDSAEQEPVAWIPIEQMYPQAKAIDILMGDGSILCAVLPQFDGDLWWGGSGTGEKFIDPKYANVTHWRIHSDTAPPSKPCEITDLLQQKFQSGNNVPVERVTITRSEYETALRSKNT